MGEDTRDSQTDLARYLQQMQRDWEENRRPAEGKWRRNRAAVRSNASLDPKGTWKKSEKSKAWQSDAFLPMSKQKEMAGYSIVRDMMFKGGRVAFMLTRDDTAEAAMAERPSSEEPVVDEGIKAQEELIHRQLEHCDAVAELSKAIHSGATYGEFWLKRYVTPLTEEAFQEVAPGSGIFNLSTTFSDSLAVEYKPVFRMFYDMEHEDLQGGRGICEADKCSDAEILEKKGKAHFIDEELVRALEQGASAAGSSSSVASAQGDEEENMSRKNMPNQKRHNGRQEFWCSVPRSIARAYERYLAETYPARFTAPAPDAELDHPAQPEADLVEIMALVINGVVVRFVYNQPRNRPYYHDYWERDPEEPQGFGVCDNVENEQKSANGLLRACEDNAKLLSNLILAGKRENVLTEIDDIYSGLFIDLDADCKNINEAIQQLVFESVIEPAMGLLEVVLAFSDKSAMIPLIEQGQQEMTAQTWAEARERLERAGKYLGSVIVNYDRVIKKIVEDLYRYNMANPELAIGKGNYKVKALGFSSFENRVVRLAKLIQTLTMILGSPDLKAISKIRYLYEEILKAQDLAPDQVIKTSLEMIESAESEMQQLQQAENGAAAGQPVDPMALEERRAKVQRLLAESEDRLAAAQLKRVQAIAADTQTKINRAKGVKELTAPAPTPAPAKSQAQPAVV